MMATNERGVTMPIQQEQKPPRGLAMELSKALCKTLGKENSKRKNGVEVWHVLRALEWTRHIITEAMCRQMTREEMVNNPWARSHPKPGPKPRLKPQPKPQRRRPPKELC